MDLDLFRTAADFFSACIFLNAAAGKIRAPAAFEGQLDNYRLLPDRVVPSAVRVLPAVELLTGAALLLAPFASRPLALVAPGGAAALLAVFAVAMAINLGRGRTEIDCGCGAGEGRQPLSWGLVGRNLSIAAVLVSLAAFAETPAGWAEVVEAAAGGLVAFILYLAQERLGALARTGGGAARPLPSPSTWGPVR